MPCWNTNSNMIMMLASISSQAGPSNAIREGISQAYLLLRSPLPRSGPSSIFQESNSINDTMRSAPNETIPDSREVDAEIRVVNLAAILSLASLETMPTLESSFSVACCQCCCPLDSENYVKRSLLDELSELKAAKLWFFVLMKERGGTIVLVTRSGRSCSCPLFPNSTSNNTCQKHCFLRGQ